MNDQYIRAVKVIDVQDGDSFTAEIDLGYRVRAVLKFRLNRINAPELREPAGKDARDFLRIICSKTLSDFVVKTYKDPRDKYGRWLAELFVDGNNINDAMVNAGQAVYYEVKS